MFTKLKEWAGVLAVVVIVAVLLFVALVPTTNKLGNATASYQDAAGGFRVNGTEVISSAGVMDGLYGGTGGTLAVTTTTALTANWDCTYDVVSVTTSTAAITLTLPPAASTTASCLTADGTWDVAYFLLATGNNYNVTFATSTGDTFTYNATSTAGGLVMATNTAGSYYKLESFRVNSSSMVYSLSNLGVGH